MASNGPIGKISQKLASGVAFATEVHQYNKVKKAAQKQKELDKLSQEIQPGEGRSNNATPSPTREQMASVSSAQGEGDEREWELDEAQDELVDGSEPQQKSKGGAANPDKLIAAFLARHPLTVPSTSPPSYDAATTTLQGEKYKLEFPVVIPQRRPQSKKRGFIRAYAPDLEDMGIDQSTWLDFIETFNEASLANPWINALNLASIAASALPSAISMAVSVAVMVATKIAIETQSRYRQNKALDKLNGEFFRPRGLYCLVMTWDSTSTNSQTTDVDLINNTIQNSLNSQGKLSHKFQSSSGTTREFEFMQTAELVFPGLDYLASVPQGKESQGLKNKIKRGKLFVDDYMDRKAQAKFAGENPDNLLSKGINPTFASKYSDPSHPIHSGSLYSLLSLGHFNPPTLRNLQTRGARPGLLGSRSTRQGVIGALGGRREFSRLGERGSGGLFGLIGTAAHAVRDRDRDQNSSILQSQPDGYQQDRYHNNDLQTNSARQMPMSRSRSSDRPLGVGRLLQEKVLYLMVVNMPTDEELAQARELAQQWNIQS
ncbi:conserved hypothetical protein [Talaromyces stipitatus ATCC 10500]|uniref:Uncharacterized protein n=1 Tax=Talaromyces stipitatus (strain ATCC 10500 / CBS 375.48 / QM 6759 / NRRL 1006) TaxID=441959 RepID=B8MPH5_TALSN|nr:uncharacterized protein TSTA_106230 [Talaromyces stipitatus ATCC 10500]EED14414.1 conserved hypothetical protein [Talaromyces stipitatus ATCC 10500]